MAHDCSGLKNLKLGHYLPDHRPLTPGVDEVTYERRIPAIYRRNLKPAARLLAFPWRGSASAPGGYWRIPAMTTTTKDAPEQTGQANGKPFVLGTLDADELQEYVTDWIDTALTQSKGKRR